MATVDDKVVAMSFESSKFESGVDKTINAINKLKEALKFPGAGKGLDDVDAAAKKVDLGHIGKAVDDIKGKLGAMSVAALAIFANLASKAVSAGARFVKAFTLDPIKAGFSEYTTNLNAVQTILANTQASGAKLKDVNAALFELNKYSDKTIYNFSQMAKNIGTFTAAGVDLKTSTAAIKGIANLAALSGSNAEQASTAMYQLSQALSAGRVSLQDWNSVVNAGMGGTVFQRALAQTAEKMGTLDEGAVKLTGKMKNVSIAGQSFRESIQAKPGEESWLTSKVLTETLKQFTGDMTDAQLKAKGFSDEQIKAIQATAKTAMQAATQVKTLSQLLDTAKETAGSGWAQTWQIIFGDFGEAKALFTGVSNAVNGFISASADARNKVLGDWKALGGRTVLIDALKNAFDALVAVIKPIKEAFRDIFPPTTGKQLYDLTVRFKEFTQTLMPGPATIDGLKRTFRGLFALLDIGKQIIGGIFTVFGKMFGAISDGSGSFLQFTGNIGDFLVSVDQALKKGDRLHNFFVAIGSVLATPIRLLAQLRDALANLFGGFSSGGFSQQMSGMSAAMTPFQKAMEGIHKAWTKFLDSFGNAGKVMQPAIDAVVKALSSLGTAIGKAVSNMDFDNILNAINTGLFGALVVMFKKFLGKGSFMDQLGGGILGNISESFEALTGSLQALQQNIKANTLLQIAIAIGVLTASIVALSMIDEEQLNKALSGLAIAFGQLLGAMALLNKIPTTGGFLKIPVIAASMILLATAVDLLVLAVKGLSGLDWEQLAKGLGGVAVLLGALSVAAGPLSRSSAGMITAGVGITAIAIAMKILASAVADFGGLSWGEIGKGLASIAVGLGLMAAAARMLPSGMVVQGAGLIAVALGLKILASAVAQFGGMNWGTIGKGMIGVSAGLLIIAGAMRLMPPNMPLTAAGLLLVSIALKGIASAIGDFGGMSVGAMAKGIIALALSLTILAAAMMAMQGSLAGAAALAVASAALALLAPALVSLGQQSWGQILKGLIGLAAAFVVLGVAGIALEPVAPALLALGAALLLIGAGLALAGAGIALIGAGLSMIAVAGPTAIGILVQALINLVEAIPRVVVGLVNGLLTIVNQLAATAPKFVEALVKIVSMLIDVVIRLSPKLGEAFDALIKMALDVIHDNIPLIIDAGFDLLMALLRGINNNIGRVIAMVVTIVITIVNTLAGQAGRLLEAGVTALAHLLQGISNTMGKVVSMAGTVVLAFVQGITDNIGRIISQGASIVSHLVSAIADGASRIVSSGVSAIAHFISGVADKLPDLVASATRAIGKFVTEIGSAGGDLADKGAKAVIHFINGVADAVRRNDAEMGRAGANLATAMIEGMVSGLGAGAGKVVSRMVSIAKGALNAAKKALHIKSPSLEFYEVGIAITDGLTWGLETGTDSVVTATEDMVDTMVDTMSTVPAAVEGLVDVQPVITPVLDLTQVQAGAQQMNQIIPSSPVVAAASYGQATSISSEQAAAQTTEEAAIPGTTTVKFEQNNYSPESLSEIEIYRQTKNQLSQLKT
ncbi:MAG TPA: tape measure protein, partial [Ktedonobacteraceae bacterium]